MAHVLHHTADLGRDGIDGELEGEADRIVGGGFQGRNDLVSVDGASNYGANERMSRRRYPVNDLAAALHQDKNPSLRLSEGLARMPSAPDIEGAEQFFSGQISDRSVLGFRNCTVMAARRGAKATLEYPLVLALLDETGLEISRFVAVEKGLMFDTCMLGVFTSEGVHMNMGHWDITAGEDVFVDRARAILAKQVSIPND